MAQVKGQRWPVRRGWSVWLLPAGGLELLGYSGKSRAADFQIFFFFYMTKITFHREISGNRRIQNTSKLGTR